MIGRPAKTSTQAGGDTVGWLSDPGSLNSGQLGTLPSLSPPLDAENQSQFKGKLQ